MDYQYKSICRGPNSIYERIKAEGIDPTRHIFIFNLRSYDRLNATPAMREQEEKSGVKYQEVQRATAEELMSSDLHGTHSKESKFPLKKKQSTTSMSSESDQETNQEERDAVLKRKEKFEEQREEVGLKDGEVPSLDSIGKSAMLDQKKVSDEPWTGKQSKDAPDLEKENFVQEELYIHAKLLIVDDKTVVCGSSNINDRVSASSKVVCQSPITYSRWVW